MKHLRNLAERLRAGTAATIRRTTEIALRYPISRDIVAGVVGFAGIASAGIDLWTDPPRRFALHVIEVHGDATGDDGKVVIKLGEKVTDTAEIAPTCSVWIDLATRRIDHSRTTPRLFRHEHLGSAVIGIALFSLPVTLPLAPVLAARSRFLRGKEKRAGMSVHGIALMETLKDQLRPKVAALLAEALRNDYAYVQKMSREVSLDEAKAILSRCTLLEEVVPADQAVDEVEARGFHWFDDSGDQVAQGSFYGTRDHFVYVLGSQFYDGDADELVGRCLKRRVHVCGTADTATEADA